MKREIANDFADFWHFEARRPKRSTPRRQEKRKAMSAFYREKVLSVRHWTDTLFSFTATRDSGFRFQNGQFAMIGLEVEGRPLLRAYSMASANHEEEL
jgi:NAD(P)H-flavin reductase